MAESWLRADATTLDELLELTPAAATLSAYRDAVWNDAATDPVLLELCRRRMAQLLGLDAARLVPHPAALRGLDHQRLAELPRWPTSPHFSERERVALAFAEQWLLDPSGMRDEDCAALRTQLGDAGCAAFTMGLALVEATLRLELTLGVAQPQRG
jgi:alkylhydroperoxidase family enzyme